MGGKSRRYLRLAIPPGVKRINVEVVDKMGLKTRRKIRVRRPSYRRLALAVQPTENAASHPTFRVTIAVAEPGDESIELEVLGPNEGDRLALKPVSKGPGRWEATFEPTATGELRIRGTLSAEGATREAKVYARYAPTDEALPSPSPRPRLATSRRVTPPPKHDRGPHFEIALGVGFLHNIGDFFSPQFSLACGATYGLGSAGSLGLRLGGSVAWKTQSISTSLDGPADLEAASSRTVLAPLFIGPIYRGPRWPVIPYASVNFVVQFVHTRNTASYTQERATLDVAPGVLTQVGAEWPLGRTSLFFQGGFLYSELENLDVTLLAGGISLEAGVRLGF
ncbi:MAG: hypothetical protein JRH20_01545 [Deltaproteobacteria bacterium]|nr:hypothetical protein [Deltaproteobacteria bacterium]